jgi:hypothetical protein
MWSEAVTTRKAANHIQMTGLMRVSSYRGLSLGGFHCLAYWEWGPRDTEHTLVCVYGRTRQDRDFGILVRTQSDWLALSEGCTQQQYGADMNVTFARPDVEEVNREHFPSIPARSQRR